MDFSNLCFTFVMNCVVNHETMNRNDFLKKLGFGALAVAIAPRVVANKETTEKKPMGWYSRTFPSYRDPQTGNNIYTAKLSPPTYDLYKKLYDHYKNKSFNQMGFYD